MSDDTAAGRIRREPPRFRVMGVRSTSRLTPRMLRVTFTGDELAGFEIAEPAASVRLLIPSPGTDTLVMPAWNGNEFLLPGGERPIIRTFTPRRFDPQTLELDLDIVIHEGGTTATWASRAGPGAAAAVSGPGRGYTIDADAAGFVLAGDETAIPAISQLIEHIPRSTPIETIVEVTGQDAILDLPGHPRLESSWLTARPGDPPGTAMVRAVTSHVLGEGTRLWVAGEAAAVHRVRRTLLGERIDRRHATIRGYWKIGS